VDRPGFAERLCGFGRNQENPDLLGARANVCPKNDPSKRRRRSPPRDSRVDDPPCDKILDRASRFDGATLQDKVWRVQRNAFEIGPQSL
jgi:hypothetical protein